MEKTKCDWTWPVSLENYSRDGLEMMVKDLRVEISQLKAQADARRAEILQLQSEVEAGKEDEKELFLCRQALDKCVTLEHALAEQREKRESAERDRQWLQARLDETDNFKQRLQKDLAEAYAGRRALAKDVEELKQVNHNLNVERATLMTVIETLAKR
jgi:chromosome segregation ATPase